MPAPTALTLAMAIPFLKAGGQATASAGGLQRQGCFCDASSGAG